MGFQLGDLPKWMEVMGASLVEGCVGFRIGGVWVRVEGAGWRVESVGCRV